MQIKYITIILFILLIIDGIVVVYATSFPRAINYTLTLSSTVAQDAFEAIKTYYVTLSSNVAESLGYFQTHYLTVYSSVWDNIAFMARLKYTLLLSSSVSQLGSNTTQIINYALTISTTIAQQGMNATQTVLYSFTVSTSIRDIPNVSGGNEIIGLPNPKPQVGGINDVIFMPNIAIPAFIATILILGWALIFRKD